MKKGINIDHLLVAASIVGFVTIVTSMMVIFNVNYLSELAIRICNIVSGLVLFAITIASIGVMKKVIKEAKDSKKNES